MRIGQGAPRQVVDVKSVPIFRPSDVTGTRPVVTLIQTKTRNGVGFYVCIIAFEKARLIAPTCSLGCHRWVWYCMCITVLCLRVVIIFANHGPHKFRGRLFVFNVGGDR